MKLIRHGAPGAEKPGLIAADGTWRDLSGQIADIGPASLGRDSMARLAAIDPATLPLVPAGTRLGPCVGGIGNVVAIGLNYADHAAESGMPVPPEPVVFNKHSGSVSGPNDDIWLPPGSLKLDWEVELGVVIGERAFQVAEADALRHVAGYCLVNDVSERSAQIERGGQWVKGKSYPTHCPLGPWLVTPDELGDPQDVDLWLDVNGQPRQRGSTRTMIFGVAQIVSYLSRFMALQPGDVIPTGTPPGVGMGMKPPTFLRAGDVVTLGGRGLGEQRQTVVAS
ncbi:MAG: fumarylacetoacetate hydrolase family protein [Hydrogenophaga sp.]|jgi:2-keto-4-pentenoate hydratase/2-oxohepta-3-ene-1,7-dioic acid hydratase in catechol pathway|uniref:fumarylacetoacetate hydrolase family protein n=1 Tax=Hydrogenophaga sp. TaxID=1904254 RepID=UPI000EE48D0F|nr:fumarylacetoacetate hydrolase family protein [Hydrogenophaga sp.]MDD3786317.1 fumarylacetoacetate hydrolase family protein [Hydrogenophaga sp.]MDX9969662.1 fumarylacetoacetate hydrolase family protein [Hydrogenophaga sp.]HAJ14165.1 2-hydroxyhepta-2,4-diene-1,7-dioate isomerase [Comamonadaceae bacterium]